LVRLVASLHGELMQLPEGSASCVHLSQPEEQESLHCARRTVDSHSSALLFEYESPLDHRSRNTAPRVEVGKDLRREGFREESGLAGPLG